MFFERAWLWDENHLITLYTAVQVCEWKMLTNSNAWIAAFLRDLSSFIKLRRTDPPKRRLIWIVNIANSFSGFEVYMTWFKSFGLLICPENLMIVQVVSKACTQLYSWCTFSHRRKSRTQSVFQTAATQKLHYNRRCFLKYQERDFKYKVIGLTALSFQLPILKYNDRVEKCIEGQSSNRHDRHVYWFEMEPSLLNPY